MGKPKLTREQIAQRARLRRAEALLKRWLLWHPDRGDSLPGTLSALSHQTAEFVKSGANPGEE